MAIFSRRSRDERIAGLVAKALVGEQEKAQSRTVAAATRGAHVIDTLPTNEDGTARTPADLQGLQARVASSALTAAPMPRMGAFTNQLGPGTPYIPTPLDPVDPSTGRAMPRRYQYDPALNLDLSRRRVPWSVLRSLADDCDLVHRCAEIRTSEIVGLDWDFAVSDHAIARIMAENQISISEAQKIARKQFADDIDKQKAFWENPDQNADVGFSEWLTEALDQHFTYDGLAIYPRFNLGGALIGLEVIDAPTIKVLRDNRGGTPLPPYPAYQQVLWGFPRGEYHASSGVPEAKQFLSDQMSYFVRNRRTASPYGFSTVEESMAAAVVYLERQTWMRGEYTQAATPPTWIKTDLDPAEYSPQQIRQWQKVVNDELSGQTAERMRNQALPKGFEPVQMQMVGERYTSDYDEFLIKQVGSKWGVAPTQLGVIPRTGLAGRGQQDGEQDQADTLSKRPTEYWLSDVLNSLSRRYLGTSRDTTITFNDPQTSDNDLAVAQSQAARVNSGIRTLNAIAVENGDPTYDMPEADEPFVLTPTGPVFLRGLLERQQAEPTPPVAVGFAGGPGFAGTPAGQQPSPVAQAPAPDTVEETAKFIRFAAKRARNGQPWRDFAFTTLDAETADDLNQLASQGEMDALKLKVVEITKAGDGGPKVLGDSRPGLGGHREEPLTDHYSPKILAAMDLGLDAHDIAARWVALGVTKASQPEDLSAPDAGADSPELNAASAFVASLQVDPDGLVSVAGQLYRDSYVAGAKAGLDKLSAAGATAPTSDLANAVSAIDWDTWQPGNPKVGATLEDGGLAKILARAQIEIKRVNGTTLGDLSQALANGVTRGESIDTIASNVDAVLHDPKRATTIARTEVNRAMSLGDIDTYQDAGLAQWDWLDSPGACPVCVDLAANSPYGVGDPTPPAHPNCRCATLPVVGKN